MFVCFSEVRKIVLLLLGFVWVGIVKLIINGMLSSVDIIFIDNDFFGIVFFLWCNWLLCYFNMLWLC